MSDIGALSDDDLKALARQQQLQSIPDDELKKLGQTQQPYTLTDQLTRGAGLSVRALAQGVAALPMMIPDAATSVMNFARNPHIPGWRELFQYPENAPSQQFDRALDPYLPKPQTKSEKLASALLSMEGGALTPQVAVESAVPSNFQTAAQVKRGIDAENLRKGQEAGYVVPPATTNPTLKNQVLETVAGKVKMQNESARINQQTRNAAAAKDLGLNSDLLTPGAVESIKQEAGNAIEGARSIPEIKTDNRFAADLDSVVKKGTGANESFPGSAHPDLEKQVNLYRVPSFTGNSAVSAIRQLRGQADGAFRSGDGQLGYAYKSTAQAIESQLQRGAEGLGGDYKDLAGALRDAKKRYAVASTVEEAMDPSGNVLGQKLAQAWKRGEPLSGNLLTAAEHATSFPKANGPVNSSNVSHLDTWGPLAGAVAGHELTHSPWGYVAGGTLPMSRIAAKAYLLSKMGQRGGVPASEVDRAFPSWTFGALTGGTNP